MRFRKNTNFRAKDFHLRPTPKRGAHARITRNDDVKDEHLNSHNTINLLRLYCRSYSHICSLLCEM